MARSLWKGPVTCMVSSSGKQISRASIISPSCIGKEFLVYNGKNKYPVSINIKMIGHKFGEFMPTRRFANHKKIFKKLFSKK